MKLIIVRHGETNYNVQRIVSFSKTKDCHLTQKGIEQAYTAKEELNNISWDIVIISEMYRAQQTAAIINEDKQKVMFIDSRINELITGIEGESYSVYKYLQEEHAAPKNAESFSDVIARVQEFIDELRKKSYDSVLIVTHLVVLRAIKQIVEDLSYEQIAEYRPGNAECYKCEL